MKFIKESKAYRVKQSLLHHFLQTYWFIPSDVLQRGIEANIWDMCKFSAPILDIGIGNGALSDFLFRNQQQIDVGIDSDPGGLDAAYATQKYKKVLCVNAEKMPFKDGLFRTVVSNSTFEHITHDIKAVGEVARVLKKGGLFFITVPSNFLQEWVLVYEQAKNKDSGKKKLEIFNNRTNHLHYRSYRQWEKIFEKNKLKIVFFKYYFPESVALFWYRLLKVFTYKIKDHELWSYFQDSKITPLVPKKIIILFLQKILLKNAYKNGFFQNGNVGAQMFIIAQKT